MTDVSAQTMLTRLLSLGWGISDAIEMIARLARAEVN